MRLFVLASSGIAAALSFLACQDPKVPTTPECSIAPPQEEHYAGAQKVASDLKGVVAGAPVQGGLSTEAQGVVDRSFAAVPNADVVCQMVIQAAVCLEQIKRTEAANDMRQLVKTKCRDAANVASPELPLVLLMDSHVAGNVYCESTRNNRDSNYNDIANMIKGLPIRIGYEPTGLQWQHQQEVINKHPALVVVHASAFQEETVSVEGNTKLLNFLDALKGTGIHVLVYTRGLPKEPKEGTLDRWKSLQDKLAEPDVKRNTELFVMPKGQASCFTDSEVGVPFTEKIKSILRAVGAHID